MTSLALVLALASIGYEPVAPAATRTVSLERHDFTVPVDFDIELAAGPPLVERPIHADFDDRGRLYVCESSGVNDKVEKQLAEKPHWILRLEDTDGDGRYDRRTRFADQMMFPEGMLWLDGSIYVAAPPSIWKLTDTDDDGIADQREEWFQGKTLTGCANDLHGPYAGPDGWIYWCKGAFATQTYRRPGKEDFVTRAAHIFRRRPDGSGLEHMMTGGMDNPVEVAFTPGGERIFTTTFFQHPGGGQRDGLVHAIYGGVYGKPHDVLDNHPRTGDLMPVLTHLGAAAPSGLARYESDAFGADYRDNLFAALFNMHKVTRHALSPAGSSFASRDEDFVVSDNLDFHPTDVLEDADGSLLVIDTGGWYKLCCPTSQLWKPEVIGGIYRVRRQLAPVVADPRGLKLDWERVAPAELVARLADARPAVTRRAVRALGKLEDAAVAPLAESLKTAPESRTRRQAVWALAHVGTAKSQEVLRAALADQDEIVRQAALNATSAANDPLAFEPLLKLLESSVPADRRLAAEALGRIGNKKAVPALLAASVEAVDRPLQHAIIFALMELGDAQATQQGLASGNPRIQRLALVALGQETSGTAKPPETLDPVAVAKLLNSSDAELRKSAAWVMERHPEWAPRLVEWLSASLQDHDLVGVHADAFAAMLTSYANQPQVLPLLFARLLAEDASQPECKQVLRILAQAGLPGVSPECDQALAQSVRNDDGLILDVIRVLQNVGDKKADASETRQALFEASQNDRLSAGVRLAALAAIPGGVQELKPEQFDFVRANLAADAPLSSRVAAADVLAKMELPEPQLLALADSVREAGPLEIERLLGPFAHSRSEIVGRSVIAALAASPSLINVRPEALAELFKQSSAEVQAESQSLYKLQAAGAADRLAQIETLLGRVSEGDVRRGQLVFNSQKAACASCHAIGYLGGSVGPDLTRVGGIRSERDLLEAILFPSASFVRSYEPITVVTTTGKTHSGILRKDAPDEVILAINATETARIPREEVEEMAPATVSIMPAGLDRQLTTQELLDLVAFLRSAK